MNLSISDAASPIHQNLYTTDDRAGRLRKEQGHIRHVRRLHETTDRNRVTLRLQYLGGDRPVRNSRELVEQRRVARRGTDCVEAELVPGKLQRHGLCGRRDAGFCGVVPRLGCAGSDGVLAGDDDGRTRPILLHLRDKNPGREVDAFDIDVKQAVEFFGGYVDAGLVWV